MICTKLDGDLFWKHAFSRTFVGKHAARWSAKLERTLDMIPVPRVVAARINELWWRTSKVPSALGFAFAFAFAFANTYLLSAELSPA